MAKLNEYNDQTKGKIHLMVTTLCDRDCKYCCNKQYNLDTIPTVTPEELAACHTVYITGGEPFLFSNPNAIAEELKRKYPNIQAVRVYTNAYALSYYLHVLDCQISEIDGLSVSIKNQADVYSFEELVTDLRVRRKKSNVLYIFPGFDIPEEVGNFKVIEREWQEDFVPEPTSIFRRI